MIEQKTVLKQRVQILHCLSYMYILRLFRSFTAAQVQLWDQRAAPLEVLEHFTTLYSGFKSR